MDQSIRTGFALTQEQVSKLFDLFECFPPEKLREYLMEIYHSFIVTDHKALPEEFEDMAMAMQMLIRALR